MQCKRVKRYGILILLALGLMLPGGPVLAQGGDDVLPQFGEFLEICGHGVQPRNMDFDAEGLLLTTFSREEMWVIDLGRDMRYPLPETRPCGPNCTASPDGSKLLYVAPDTATYWQMSPNGFNRESIFPYYLSQLDFWDDDYWIAWPTSGVPALYPIGQYPTEENVIRLNDYDVYSVQPGGYRGLRIMPGQPEWSSGEYPVLELVNLEDGTMVPIVEVTEYQGAAYWSPDGVQLAIIGPGVYDESVGLRGSELFLVEPGTDEIIPLQLTNFSAKYGAVRLAGYQTVKALTWSPDGRYLAYWVIEIIGPDEAVNVGQAVIHVTDTLTGLTTQYCGFGSAWTNPYLPELVWSPDGNNIAFGLDQPGDSRPPIMYVLEVASGNFWEVSEGMYAAFGTYDPVMWGIP